MSFFKKTAIILLVSFLFVQCAKENQFLVEKGKVGYLNKETVIRDLNSIFEKDSIVANLTNSTENEYQLFSVANDEYVVYSKKGKKLLEIIPTKLNDSLSKASSALC